MKNSRSSFCPFCTDIPIQVYLLQFRHSSRFATSLKSLRENYNLRKESRILLKCLVKSSLASSHTLIVVKISVSPPSALHSSSESSTRQLPDIFRPEAEHDVLACDAALFQCVHHFVLGDIALEPNLAVADVKMEDYSEDIPRPLPAALEQLETPSSKTNRTIRVVVKMKRVV